MGVSRKELVKIQAETVTGRPPTSITSPSPSPKSSGSYMTRIMSEQLGHRAISSPSRNSSCCKRKWSETALCLKKYSSIAIPLLFEICPRTDMGSSKSLSLRHSPYPRSPPRRKKMSFWLSNIKCKKNYACQGQNMKVRVERSPESFDRMVGKR